MCLYPEQTCIHGMDVHGDVDSYMVLLSMLFVGGIDLTEHPPSSQITLGTSEHLKQMNSLNITT